MDLAEKILNGWAMTKPQRPFLLNLFTTILSLRGKVTFRNLSRYSGLSARTYARQFDQSMDFIGLNRALIDTVVSEDQPRLIAFDPCFIPKAGQHTPELAYFWNGCHGRAEKGLEVSVFSLIDLAHHTGYALSVQQTPAPATQWKLGGESSLYTPLWMKPASVVGVGASGCEVALRGLDPYRYAGRFAHGI